MIGVESWTVQEFQAHHLSGALSVNPEFQRRDVWNQKAKMLLADSVARAIPIGAVTLYADQSQGYDIYEVIDGKQRLTALLEFLDNQYSITTSTILAAALDDDEFDPESDITTNECHGRLFLDIPQPRRMSVLQYKIPVFVVRGDRSDAIRSFTRMNSSSYSLTPQEIRNAFFNDSKYLKSAIQIAADLDSMTSDLDLSFFVGAGVISKEAFLRMQDIQFISELLLLAIEGPQHRRDRIDAAYGLYREPTGAAARLLADSSNDVLRIAKQLQEIAAGAPLQALHFPARCENDYYGLFGALRERGILTRPQLDGLQPELQSVISGFRRQVTLFIDRVRDGKELVTEEYGDLVERYGRGFLGGQINSKDRRRERIQIWKDVINGVVATLDTNSGFSETQRRLIWARSEDKLCSRCSEIVLWKDFHAGHKMAYALGGATQVANGQVEHATCNQIAGTS